MDKKPFWKKGMLIWTDACNIMEYVRFAKVYLTPKYKFSILNLC